MTVLTSLLNYRRLSASSWKSHVFITTETLSRVSDARNSERFVTPLTFLHHQCMHLAIKLRYTWCIAKKPVIWHVKLTVEAFLCIMRQLHEFRHRPSSSVVTAVGAMFLFRWIRDAKCLTTTIADYVLELTSCVWKTHACLSTKLSILLSYEWSTTLYAQTASHL